jgi:hypothetical protein
MPNTIMALTSAAALLVAADSAVGSLYVTPTNYYSFDNSADPGHDDSENGRNGAVTGATWVNDSVRGSGVLEFGSGDRVSATVPALPGSGVTISLWALRNDQHTGGNDGLFSTDGKGLGGWVAGNDRIWGRIREADGSSFNLPQDADAEMPGDDIWTHLVYRATGEYYELWQDGSYTGNRAGPYDGTLLATSNLTVGRQGTESWYGRLDDFAIWDQGLADWQIRGLAHGNFGPAAVPIPEPATLLIWSLLAGLGLGLGWRRRRRTK